MAEKMDHSPAVDSHRGLTSQKKRCHSDDDNDKSDVDLDSSVDDHGAPVLMEKLRRFSKRLVTSNTTVRCQGAAERYRPESCGCATRCSADRCPCVKSNTTCNEACQCVDCSNPFIQLQLLSHYGLSLVQCKQDVCLMEALPKLTDQELRQILGTHVPMDCCDTFVTLFELIPDKRPCPNNECDRTYTYSWCENRVLPVTEESERNHCPKRRRCIKPTEQQSHEQVPIQVEENNVGEQRNLGVSSMSSPNKDKGQKAMRKTNKFKSPRLLCMFCGKTQAKLSRHLQTMHKNERTLNHALTLSRALESDQYKSQPSSGPVDRKRYLKNCDKAKHARQLHREEAKTDQCIPTQYTSPGPSKEVNSKRKYREKVLDRLSQDSIGVLCRQDTMIVETGWKLYQNCCDKRNYEFVRELIRNLGSLLSQCRNISGNESMAGEDLLNKKNFHVLVTAIRNRSSGLSGNSLQTLHWKMRHILQNAFETMKAKYTAEGIVHKGKAVDHFYNELLAKWQLLFTTQGKLSGNAKATQKHKVSSAQKQKLKSAYQLKVSKNLSRHNKPESLSKKRGKERHKPATLSTQRDTGRHKTATLSTGRDTGRHETATLSTGRDTGRHKTATLSTGRDTGRHKPATLSTGRDTGRHEPATLSTGRDTGKYTAKPPSLDRDTEKPESEMLSIETEMKKLRTHTMAEIYKRMRDRNPSVFQSLRALVVSRLQMFNIWHGGAPVRLLLKEWEDLRTRGSDKEQEDGASTDPILRHLLNKVVLTQQTQGDGAEVPLLIPKDLLAAMDKLAEIRSQVTVSKDNPYLFPYGRLSQHHCRAWEALMYTARAAGLKDPHAVVDRKTRQRTAMYYLLLDVNHADREGLLQYMEDTLAKNEQAVANPIPEILPHEETPNPIGSEKDSNRDSLPDEQEKGCASVHSDQQTICIDLTDGGEITDVAEMSYVDGKTSGPTREEISSSIPQADVPECGNSPTLCFF